MAAGERLGIRTERFLDRVRLSGSVLEQPQRMIARAQVWGFENGIAREEGIPAPGLEAATTDPLTTLGAFGRQLLAEPTLFAALSRLVREFERHSTHARFRIEEIPEGIRVVRHDAGYVRETSDVVEQYTVMVLVSIVRRAAPDWRADRLWLRSASAWSTEHELLADAETRTGSAVTGVGVPRPLLARRLAGDEAPEAGNAAGSSDVPGGFQASLKRALEPLVGRLSVDLDLAAELVGASPRTVRHRLSAEGTSWRQLLDELRCEQAHARLAATDQRVAEIAFELGYSDAAHFTRAFRRWTGVTPSTVRRQPAGDASRDS